MFEDSATAGDRQQQVSEVCPKDTNKKIIKTEFIYICGSKNAIHSEDKENYLYRIFPEIQTSFFKILQFKLLGIMNIDSPIKFQ